MSTQMLPFINPATGVQYGQLASSTLDDVEKAVADMRHALPTWQAKSPRTRAAILRRFKEYLIDSADDIARVLNRNCGKTMQDGMTEVFITVDNLSQMIRHAPGWLRRKRVPRGLYLFRRYYTEPTPFGVAAVIGPWNYPVVQVMTPVMAALIAGNTVVLKGSEITPEVSLLFERLFKALPELAPYVRVLHGGADIGAALVASPPDIIFVTGSEGTGQKISEAAAKTLTPVITELGGKDPLLVLEDADIDAAAKWAVWGAYYHSGQVCMSVERVYAVESIYDRFVEKVIEENRRFQIGYSPDKESPYNCGPITDPRQIGIIQNQLDDALKKGARILTGGENHGHFFAPTVLVNVDHSMDIMREETFGPTLPIMKVANEQEAITLANDSKYGLSSYVWSNDLHRAEKVAHQLETGTVLVNDAMAHYAVSQLPFGGRKRSGSGRIHGKHEVLQFTQPRGFAIGGPPFPLDIATIFRSPGNYDNMKRLMQLVFGSNQQRLAAIFPERESPAGASSVPHPAVRQRVNGSGKAGLLALGAATVGIVFAVFTLSKKKKG